MIDRLITIIIVAALIAWCVLAVHYHRESHSSRLSIGLERRLVALVSPLPSPSVTMSLL